MKDVKKSIKNFGQLVNGNVVGGFSHTIESASVSESGIFTNKGCQVSNNCNGGNCKAGCGQ